MMWWPSPGRGQVPTSFTVDFGFGVRITSAPSTLQHTAAVFDGATLVSDLDGDTLDVIDNSTYPINRSRRFNVNRDTFINGAQPAHTTATAKPYGLASSTSSGRWCMRR
jgi:hypothetical protein